MTDMLDDPAVMSPLRAPPHASPGAGVISHQSPAASVSDPTDSEYPPLPLHLPSYRYHYCPSGHLTSERRWLPASFRAKR